MKKLTKFKNGLFRGYLIVGSVAIVVLVIAAFVQVVARYVFNNSPSWTEEMARFMFVWASFLGAAVALDKGMHATITVLQDKLSPNARRIVVAFTTLVVMGLSILLLVQCCKLCMSTMSRPSPVMKIPMAYINVSLAFSGFGMLVSCLDTLFSLFSKDEKEETEV